MVTFERTARRDRRPPSVTLQKKTLKTNKKYTKHHVFAPTAGALSAISPKLCMVIELVEAIKEGGDHFSIQCIVFHTGCTEKLGLVDRRAFSQQ